jgi:hypothetical protein
MSDYDTDFYTWTQQQAQALAAKDWPTPMARLTRARRSKPAGR